MVARLVRDQKAASSNLVTSTSRSVLTAFERCKDTFLSSLSNNVAKTGKWEFTARKDAGLISFYDSWKEKKNEDRRELYQRKRAEMTEEVKRVPLIGYPLLL